jgi:hypothetical protein
MLGSDSKHINFGLQKAKTGGGKTYRHGSTTRHISWRRKPETATSVTLRYPIVNTVAGQLCCPTQFYESDGQHLATLSLFVRQIQRMICTMRRP